MNQKDASKGAKISVKGDIICKYMCLNRIENCMKITTKIYLDTKFCTSETYIIYSSTKI